MPASKIKSRKPTSRDLAKSRLKNVKSKDEREQVMWELEEMSRFASKRGRVAETSLPLTEGGSSKIMLSRLRGLDRGFQHVGTIKSIQVTFNIHTAAHAGSMNATGESGRTFLTFDPPTSFSIWTERHVGRLRTFFDWSKGEFWFETRFVKSILLTNKANDTIRVPTGSAWYVLDENNQVVKYNAK